MSGVVNNALPASADAVFATTLHRASYPVFSFIEASSEARDRILSSAEEAFNAKVEAFFGEAIDVRMKTGRPLAFTRREATANNVVYDRRVVGLPETGELWGVPPAPVYQMPFPSNHGWDIDYADRAFVRYQHGRALMSAEDLAHYRVEYLRGWAHHAHSTGLVAACTRFLKPEEIAKEVKWASSLSSLRWGIPGWLQPLADDVLRAHQSASEDAFHEAVVCASEVQTARLLENPAPVNDWGQEEFLECTLCEGSSWYTLKKMAYLCPDCLGTGRVPVSVAAESRPSLIQRWQDSNDLLKSRDIPDEFMRYKYRMSRWEDIPMLAEQGVRWAVGTMQFVHMANPHRIAMEGAINAYLKVERREMLKREDRWFSDDEMKSLHCGRWSLVHSRCM